MVCKRQVKSSRSDVTQVNKKSNCTAASCEDPQHDSNCASSDAQKGLGAQYLLRPLTNLMCTAVVRALVGEQADTGALQSLPTLAAYSLMVAQLIDGSAGC